LFVLVGKSKPQTNTLGTTWEHNFATVSNYSRFRTSTW
jgi:hypothetical protein